MSNEPYDYDICIIYHDADKAWTTKLVRSLEQEDVKVFFTLSDAEPGRTMHAQMVSALMKSRRIGIVLSPDFTESYQYDFEHLLLTNINASEWEERVICLLRRTTGLAPPLARFSYIDFRDDALFEECYRQLLAVIKNETLASNKQTTNPGITSASSGKENFEEALRRYNESLEISKRLGDQSGIASALYQLGTLAQAQGELEEARRLYGESLEIWQALGNQTGIANALRQLGMLEQEQGKLKSDERREHRVDARADEAEVEQVSSQVNASQTTKSGQNRGLEILLRMERERARPGIAKLIDEVLAEPDNLELMHILARLWRQQGQDEEAALLYRHILSRQPKDEEAQRALNKLQKKKGAPSSVGTNETKKTATPSPKFSTSLQRVLLIAEALRIRLKHPYTTREILLASLFLDREKSMAFDILSAFGVKEETLAARLLKHYGNNYPGWLLVQELKDESAKLESSELARVRTNPAQNMFNEWLVMGNDSEADKVFETLFRFSVPEFHPRHLFCALMDGDTSGWIEDTLGKRETNCIKSLIDKKGFNEQITRDDVLYEAAGHGLYGKAPAHRDSAAKEDLLGFEPHANALVDIIEKDETRPPLVIGVYGPWGAGKSTFMGLVKQKLDNRSEERARGRAELSEATSLKGRLRRAFARPLRARRIMKERLTTPAPLKVVTIEYDAWAYADTPKLWSGLIGKVAKELDAELGWYGRFAYLFRRHSRRLTAAIVVGLVPVVLFALGVVARWLQTFAATHAAGANLSDFLQQAGLGALLGSNALGKIAGVATPIISLLYALTLQKRPVTDAVTALAARFDSAPAAGIISRIQDEFKTALETKINPAQQPETEDAKKSKIRQRVEQNQLKIVVFIDELDRCPLERIVDILEAIKLFLAEDIFIVFLGVDTRVAAEAIRLHYKDVKNPDLPREYLEKIVQLPLRVPQADETEIKKYLSSFMPGIVAEQNGNGDGARATGQTSETTPDKSYKSVTPNTFEQAANRNADRGAAATTPNTPAPSPPPLNVPSGERTNALPASPGVGKPGVVRNSRAAQAAASAISSLPTLLDTQLEYDWIAIMAREFLESNPRRIKRLLNTYRYVKILASASEGVVLTEWQAKMIAWLAFTMRWPAFMERAVEAAQAAKEDVANKGYAEFEKDYFLLTLLNDNTAREEQPTRSDIEKYLPFNAKEILHQYVIAGNFLIENPRPYTDAARVEQTPSRPTAQSKGQTRQEETKQI